MIKLEWVNRATARFSYCRGKSWGFSIHICLAAMNVACERNRALSLKCYKVSSGSCRSPYTSPFSIYYTCFTVDVLLSRNGESNWCVTNYSISTATCITPLPLRYVQREKVTAEGASKIVFIGLEILILHIVKLGGLPWTERMKDFQGKRRTTMLS